MYIRSKAIIIIKTELEEITEYRKRGKIRWAKHSRFSRFLSLPRKFSHEFLAIRK